MPASLGYLRVMRPQARSWRRLFTFALGVWALMGNTWGIYAAQSDTVKAVSFIFKDIENRTIRLADYRGQWVLVGFWAPWCPLCKIQIPTLNKLNARKDFRVIGIALDYGDNHASVNEAINLNQMQFEANVLGGSRNAPNSAFLQVGPVDFFPTSYLYDPTGEIVMYIPGQVRLSSIVSFMDKWHAEKGGADVPAFATKAEKFATFLHQRYGERGDQAYAAWKGLLDGSNNTTPMQKLLRVNNFFNQRIQASDGRLIWGRPDYWATPGEVLGGGRGDSADIAIAKYFTLLALNIAPEKLRLIYVKPRGETLGTGSSRVHMVLAYYETPGRDPMILDHRLDRLLPASSRTDLQPVYSFNSLGVWDETAKAVAAGESGRLATWEDTLRRARAQGFE